MATKIEFISSALLLLGDKGTNTLGSDASANVKSAEVLYDLYYPIILSERVWRFALKSSVISKVVNPPNINQWNYAYQLPEDYLLISHLQPNRQYEIVGTYLYANLDNTNPDDLPTLFYTHKVNESILPAYFQPYLIEKLASIFAMKVTNNANIAQLWAQSADLRKRDAIALDYQSQTSQQIPSNSVVAAHYGLGLNLGYSG